MSNFLQRFLILFLWTGAIFQGFFYEPAYLAAAAALWLSLAYVKEIRFSYFHVLLGLLVIVYWISWLFGADPEQGLLEAEKMSTLLPIGFFLTWIPEQKRLTLLKALPWIGAALTCVGVLFHLERQGRLESLIEYANALAMLLLVAVLVSIFLYLKDSRRSYLFLLVINGAGLLLTFSRAVWVLWLASLLLLVVLFPEIRNKTMFPRIGACHILSWLMAAAVKLDPLFFLQRVKSIQPEASELQIRLRYWQDSLRMICDHIWLGTGGGGWSLLQSSYQSKAYYVKYVHNHFLQVALDVGVVGLLVWSGMIVWFYVHAWRRSRQKIGHQEQAYWAKARMLLVTVMLLHAGFDFDLSFPLLFALLICLMAMEVREPLEVIRPKSARFVKYGLCFAGLCLAGFSLWLAAGYLQKQMGVNLAQAGRLQEGAARLEGAQQMLPWSHTVKYEAAKVYVRLGNSTRDLRYYQAAKQQLGAALRIVPAEKLYQSLMQELNKVPES